MGDTVPCLTSARQAHHRPVDRFSHAVNLAIFPLRDRDLEESVFPGIANPLHHGGPRGAVTQLDAAPQPLPSEDYADASHPLNRGYAELARRLGGWPYP